MIKYIAVHNTGGTQADNSASSQNMTAAQVDAYHKSRWNFRSELGRYGGYNFFIDRNGDVTQFRKIGEETAAQYGHNFDTISICLAGNFSVMSMDRPTKLQEKALVHVIDWIMRYQFGMKSGLFSVKEGTVLNVDVSRIVPHRALQSGTECNGMKLENGWARDLYMREAGMSFFQQIIATLKQKIQLLLIEKKKKGLGGDDRCCEDFIG